MSYIKDDIDQLLIEAETLHQSDILYRQVQIYKRVLELDNTNNYALINLSDCFIKMNLDDEAKKYAYRAYSLHHKTDDMIAANYSCILINQKQYDDAIKILEIERSKNSTNYLVYNNLAYTYFLTDQYFRALDNYSISISLEEENPLAYCNRGILKYFIFNDDEGIDDLEVAHKLGDTEAVMILQNILKSSSFCVDVPERMSQLNVVLIEI